MRHARSGRYLGRNSSQRKALIRGLVCSIFNSEKIETTLAKAKEVQPFTERMISLGIDGSLAARRRAFAFINQRSVVDKLFNDIAKRYDGPQGGYTRVIKTRLRKGDGAVMAVIELVKMKLSEVAEPVAPDAAKEAKS